MKVWPRPYKGDLPIITTAPTPPPASPLPTLAYGHAGVLALPTIITDAGEAASRRFVEFFAASIHNHNSRLAYMYAVARFLAWCDARHLALKDIEPVAVAAYIQSHPGAPPTVKQHLAALRRLFDHLVTGQVLKANPAASVRGPRYVVKKGKTPVLAKDDARRLLETIDTQSLVGLRDRALISVMIYSFARVGAVVGLRVGDYYQNGKRWWLRLREKGGKHHELPAHHKIEEFLDAYLSAASAAGVTLDRTSPLFRTTVARSGQLTAAGLDRRGALAMVKRRANDAGISPRLVCNHSFRATGITAYLMGGGSLEKAAAIAAHESPRTTRLYDRTVDIVSLDEIERIVL